MAMVAQAFLENLVGELLAFIEGEISMQLGVKEEVKTLQRRLKRLKGFLEYAEQRSYTDFHIATLVKELKDVMYDADDILDTCMIEGGKLLGVEQRSPILVVRSPFTTISSSFRRLKYHRQISKKIQKLSNLIDEIAKDNQIIGIFANTVQTARNSDHHQVLLPTRQTSPIQDGKSIVGPQIEEAARKLIASIVKNDEIQFQIFAITGMGGIGKTTLARRVFNDENITSSFPKQQIWLHVSKDYSEAELLKEMIRNLGDRDEGLKSRAELELKLATLIPESLFLVLDDIWSADVWLQLLRGPMNQRVTKCRVLVTTRDENLARSLRANIHHVEKLDKDSCWELLCKEIFEDGEEDAIYKLGKIGSEIVEKCDGLPLAIKTVAGVLKGKEKDEAEWGKVLKSEIWSMSQISDEVPRALYLSYQDLPPILKQCFLYCSLICSNGSMDRDDLVRYWIDEGFVVTKEGTLMEDVAEDCYRELMFRNLLQPDPTVLDATVCTMHDLLRSLGQFLTEGEAICIREDQKVAASPSLKLRRLLIMSNISVTVMLPDGVTEPEFLRAFFICRGVRNRSIDDGLFKKLCNLRILMLSNSKIERLPYSIGLLVHLRHLDLDGTNIEELPSSIGRLANLQTLRARRCILLNQLPNAVMKLHKLRLLHVEDTPLSYVPKGIGQLTNLNAIRGLVIGYDGVLNKKEEKGCDLEELQPLFNLRVLGLHMLGRSSDRRTASLSLADKSFLTELLLSEEHVTRVEEAAGILSYEQILRTEKIYNHLTPPSGLRTLAIVNFPGRVFPIWMMSTSLADYFPVLTTLHLVNATSCTQLPPQLSQLPRLSYLLIKMMYAITCIEPQFFACAPGDVAFPNLQFMRFEIMPNWEIWLSLIDAKVVGNKSTDDKIRLLPKLRQLVLDDCPKLIALPNCLSLVSNLKTLWIMQAHELKVIKNLPCLVDELVVVECQSLWYLSNLPSVKHLTVDSCPRLQFVGNVEALQDLFIETSEEHLPTWLSELVLKHPFKKLEMRCTQKLLKDCMRDSPNWVIIQQIPEVKLRTIDSRLYVRYTKSPYSYQTNAKSPLSYME